ncbi:MAG: ATPase, T2SS/T4P/T4SS family [Candidatus Sericytochromatia bacterium]
MSESVLPESTLLCIDDSPDILLLAKTILKKAGYRVLTATGAQEAVAVLTQERPQLILLDIMMPDMDGYSLCRKLQNYPALANIPVIFVSAQLNHEADQLKAFQAGGVDFVQKPFESDQLLNKVRYYLSTGQIWEKKLTSVSRPSADRGKAKTLSAFKTWIGETLSLPLESLGQLEFLNLSETFLFLGSLGISEKQTLAHLGEFLDWPVLEQVMPAWLQLGIFPLSFIRSNGVLPLQESINHPLTFALSNPFDLALLDLLNRYPGSQRTVISPQLLEQSLKEQVEPLSSATSATSSALVVTSAEIPVANQPETRFQDLEQELAELYLPAVPLESETQSKESETQAEDSPFVTRLVNRLIENACELDASDIHLEPQEHDVVVRYRIDGHLREMHRLTPLKLILPLSSRLKIMSNLNIAERRLPQDGRISFKHFSARKLDVDLRLSTIPSQFGESVVMRIIYKHRSQVALPNFGFTTRSLALYREGLRNPYGIILNVGPTGSGKTTTLYAALNELNTPDRKILTIEDPIEYSIPGIVQVEAQTEIGLSFQRVLRAFLRHDPDIILLGEIRDRETAKIAIEASLTGHLVLSTMHTNDAPSTITRFMEMDIPPFMISASLMMVCAQRLIRRLCPACKEPYEATSLQKQQLKADVQKPLVLYRSKGCVQCGQIGYRGRLGIHEILLPTDLLRETLSQGNCTTETVRNLALKHCQMIPLYQDAQAKVVLGETSLEEINSRLLDADRSGI